jgi:hypothetical protein
VNSYDDPPSPRNVIRGVLGVALGVMVLALLIESFASGRVGWPSLGLVLALWGAWSFFGSLFDNVLAPLARFAGTALTGGPMPPDTRITIEEETGTLERVVAADPPPPPHRVIIAGIRLAEIYRTHEKNDAKADALIARLAARYPDARELTYVRSTTH